MPKLPRAWRPRRRARPASRQRRRAPHSGPAHSTGDSRRRQHARIREEPQSGRDDGAGRVSRTAASGKSTAGARGRTRFHQMILAFVFLALGYMRGWLRLRSTSAEAEGAWRAAGFLLGLVLIWIAVAS